MPEVLDFNIGTSTGVLSVATGGTLKAGIFYTNAQTGTTTIDNASTDLKWSVGFTVGTGTTGLNQCVTTQAEDGSAAANCDRYMDTGNVFTVLTTAGAIDGEAFVSTINSTSVKFTRPVAFNGDYRVGGWVFHTTDITDATIVRFTADTGGSTQSVTGLGFQPTLVFFTSIADTATDTRVDDGTHSFGVGLKTSTGGIKNAVFCRGSDNGADPTKVRVHCGNQRCIVLQQDGTNVDTVDGAASFLDTTTGGFDIFWDNTPTSADEIIALAIRAPNVNLFEGNFGSTDTATVAVSGAGFAPVGGLVVSPGVGAESTTGAFGTAGTQMLGAFTSPTARNAYGTRELNNQATANQNITRSETLVGIHPNGTNRQYDVNSMDADGVTFITDAGLVADYFWTPLFGPSTGAATTVRLKLSANLLAPQFAVPDGDLKAWETGSTVFTWVNELAGTTGLWASIDETVASDTDWIQSGETGADIDSISWATTTINKDMGPDDWCAATAEGGDVHSLTHHTDGELYGVSLDGEHIGTCLTDGKITGSQWYKYNPTANTLPTDGAFNGLTHLRSKTNVYATGILSVEDGGGAGVDRIYVWEINASPFDKTRLGYTDDEFATAVTYPAGAGWDYDNEGATKDWAAGSPTFIQAGQGYADGDATYVYAVCTNGGDTYPEDVVHLMRAPRTSAATVANHEFWDGSGWDSDPANASAIITRTGAVMWGACGVYWKPIDRWLITFATSATGDWALYQAPAVTGPYTLVEDQTDFVDTTQKFVFQPNLRQSSADGLTMRMGFSGTGTYDAACWVSGTVTLV